MKHFLSIKKRKVYIISPEMIYLNLISEYKKFYSDDYYTKIKYIDIDRNR
jgi:hypothetical protein